MMLATQERTCRSPRDLFMLAPAPLTQGIASPLIEAAGPIKKNPARATPDGRPEPLNRRAAIVICMK
jgi:hypothetical protein